MKPTKTRQESNVKIDMKQMGEFLRNLRKSEGFSQEALAKYLFVTRQAISLWENGDALPEHESIICICNFFKITADELYKGMYDDPKRQTLLYKILMNKQIQKYKKLLITFIIFIILSTVGFTIFTIRYFFIVHNNVNVYNIGSDNTYEVKGELSQSVNDINMFVSINKVVNKLCIAYKDSSNNIVCKNNTNNLNFYETIGYSEVLPNTEVDDIINNLYINIFDENDNTYSKLNFDKFFQNTDVLFNKNKSIVDGNEAPMPMNNKVPENIMNNFKFDKEENKYYLEIKEKAKKIELAYYINNKSFIIREIANNTSKTLTYLMEPKSVSWYVESDDVNKKIIKTYDDFSDKDTNEDKKKIYNYFEENYLRKYIY